MYNVDINGVVCMSATYKKTAYNSKLNFNVHYLEGYNIGDAYSSDLHYDAEFTLAYFKKADATIQIEGNIYTISDGDLVILNHDELHCVNVCGDKFSQRITIFVNNGLLDSLNYSSDTFFDSFQKRSRGIGNLILSRQVKKSEIDKKIEEVHRLISSEEDDKELLALCKIIEVMCCINKIVNPISSRQNLNIDSNSMINEVIKYLNLHFKENIDCQKIADDFHLSKCHLSRVFKSYVGVSLWEYVIKRRIIFFNDLIRENNSIEEACFKSGFNNYSNFYRLYKKHTGITPMEFKRQLNR